MTVPELLDLQITQSPQHAVYVYDNPDGKVVTIRMEQYVRTVHQAAKQVQRHVEIVCGLDRDDHRPVVIGLLASIGQCFLPYLNSLD